MCGFLITNYDNLRGQRNILKHRGPDNYKHISVNKINFHFNRLKILDLNNRSNQPFRFKNYILCYNGEIFNYLEIKSRLEKLNYRFKTSSDTEVLIYSFIEWGEECLEMFEGMFSFVIYDEKKSQFFIGRDAFGIKPLFYNIQNNKFILSSEIKNILKYNIKTSINKISLNYFLNFGVYQNNKNTFYKNIYSLEPGHYAILGKNKFQTFKWYKTKSIKVSSRTIDINSDIKFLINKAIKLSLRSDKEVALSLSSGIDSYYIYENQKENNFENISSFYHWSCKDENSEEKKLIKEINQKRLKISYFKKKEFFTYFEKCLNIINGPVGGLNFLSALKGYESIKKNKIRVLIDGTGADEILGGYKHYINSYTKKISDKNTQYVQGLKINYYPEIFKKKSNFISEKFYQKIIFKDRTKNLMINDLLGSKMRRSLNQLDHLTMSNSIEGRFPYLNHELINYCLAIPNSHLFHNNLGKIPLRNLVKNKKIAFSEKNSLQTPQIKWMHNFIFDKFFNELKFDDDFFP